jgi:LysM repeat protein
VLLALIGLTAITEAQALDGNKFDPGLIISDSVFFDFGTMSVDDIQRFLESQVPVCKSKSTGMPCLRNYKADTPEKSADPGKCAYMPAKTNISAAQMIYDISRACGINPRVLLVTLQKEQGLVQSTIPSPYMYRAAMGYGCPDSDPGICGKVWVGLFNQLYKAAGQFQWYGDPNGSFTYLRPGRQISIDYNPDSSKQCGKKTFTLKSQATANLYYYTPFTPNDAALRNLYGIGDRCSAYGNRNFWRFYWDWFGSPIGGGFLLKSSTSDVYFISNDVKYPLADPGLADDLAPLGPLGEISQDYLNSFPTGIPMTRIVKTPAVNGTSVYFFISGGKKYVFANCDQATNFGLDCNNAVELTRVQLDALPTGTFRPDVTAVVKSVAIAPATPSYFLISPTKKYPLDCAKASNLGVDCTKATQWTTAQLNALPTVRLPLSSLGISAMLKNADGTRVFIQNGLKREVLDDASLSAAGIPDTAPSPLELSDFNYLPWGPPLAQDGSLFVNRASNREGLIINNVFYDIDPATRSDIDFTKWFSQSSGSLGQDGLSAIPNTSVIKSLVIDDNEDKWLLSDVGKIKVTDTNQWAAQAVALPNVVLEKFPTVADSTINGFNFIQVKDQKTIYLLKDGLARQTFNAADRVILGNGMVDQNTITVSPSGFAFMSKGVMVLPAGLVVKNRSTGVVGIIDGANRMVTLDRNSVKLKLPEPRALTNLQLLGYSKQEVLGPYKVTCGGQIYIAANDLIYEVPVSVAKDFPMRSTSLSDASCSLLTITDVSMGHYLGTKTTDSKTGKVKFKAYKISKGKRYPFKTLADYKLDNIAEPPLVFVDESFLANLPLGNEIDLGGGAKPTPEPKPTPKPKTYTIVAGDSLTSIAAKFGTTVAKLMAVNGIVNADRIRIGQVIKLP